MTADSSERDPLDTFEQEAAGTTTDPSRVSGRFLTDLFRVLDAKGLPSSKLLGDLPIALGEHGEVVGSVEWDHFVEFMRRLSRAVGGAAELERVATRLGPMKPARALSSLAGFAASPRTLYRAAAGWALRRAMPAVETKVTRTADGQIEIHAWIREGQRACPELFHFAVGGAQAMPKVIGLGEAVVVAEIHEREALYRITVPPSPNLFARLGRIVRTLFSAGDVLRFLESQQLELNAKNEQLRRANAALTLSEQRYRALVETAVDVLCEIDREGRVVYVSASVEQMIGYAPEQVTGSHYRLWTPQAWHDRVDEVIEALFDLPAGRATQEIVRLHSADGESVFAELTARTYDTLEGERRLVCIGRDVTERAPSGNVRQATQEGSATVSRTETDTDLDALIERALGDVTLLEAAHDDFVALTPIDEEKDAG